MLRDICFRLDRESGCRGCRAAAPGGYDTAVAGHICRTGTGNGQRCRRYAGIVPAVAQIYAVFLPLITPMRRP